MRVILSKTITIYTYDKTTIILRIGTEVIFDPKESIAMSAEGYYFDIEKSEYSVLN